MFLSIIISSEKQSIKLKEKKKFDTRWQTCTCRHFYSVEGFVFLLYERMSCCCFFYLGNVLLLSWFMMTPSIPWKSPYDCNLEIMNELCVNEWKTYRFPETLLYLQNTSGEELCWERQLRKRGTISLCVSRC